MDHDSFFALADRLADCAAEETLSRFRQGAAVTNKRDEGFDPVTEADRQAEKALRALLEEACPTHGIHGEEFAEKPGDGVWRWVLDPVDGTRAFICGIPVWTTLIGLERNGIPVAGIIDQPFSGERWTASLLGETPAIRTSGRVTGQTAEVEDLSAAKMMVTDMRVGEYFTAAEADAAAALAAQVQLTRQGLDSYGFGLVASGQMDLVVEAGLHWHDIAAVIPVIQAAGGTITDWQGESLSPGDSTYQIIAAATPALARAAAMVLRG